LPEGLPIDLYNSDLESEHTSVCLIREYQDQLKHESLRWTHRCSLCHC
jgi:hypothetical protein